MGEGVGEEGGVRGNEEGGVGVRECMEEMGEHGVGGEVRVGCMEGTCRVGEGLTMQITRNNFLQGASAKSSGKTTSKAKLISDIPGKFDALANHKAA